jgi:methylmalonyl-CoA mutase
LLDNVPGSFPYTAGSFASSAKAKTRRGMFAGEGDAYSGRTAASSCSPAAAAKRLSPPFDSVTLYGNDPDLRPDIYGKVGNSACRSPHSTT